MCETGIKPANLYFPTEANPADAIHPHSAHAGRPPNWHGVMGVDKSAETHVVICANRHCCGEVGGCKYPSRTILGRCTLGYEAGRQSSWLTASARFSGVRRSSDSFPSCGVKRLNQILR